MTPSPMSKFEALENAAAEMQERLNLMKLLREDRECVTKSVTKRHYRVFINMEKLRQERDVEIGYIDDNDIYDFIASGVKKHPKRFFEIRKGPGKNRKTGLWIIAPKPENAPDVFDENALFSLLPDYPEELMAA